MPRTKAAPTGWKKYDRFRDLVFQDLGYKPSVEQKAFHDSRARVRLVVGGERGGKSYSSAMEGLVRTPYSKNGAGAYWIVGPDYLQARPEFTYILDGLKALGRQFNGEPSMPSNIASPWVLRMQDGTTWETKSASDIKKLASFAIDGVIMAEAAQQDFEVFLKLRGRLAERRGWLIMSGTFEAGNPWYEDLFERWRQPNREKAESFSLPTWSNMFVFPGGREDPEIKEIEAALPPDIFMRRFGAIPAKPVGLVFKEFTYGTHVKELEIEEELPVYLAIDPGYAGAYAVLAIQVVGSHVHVIDEVYVRNGVAEDVIAMCENRNWWEQVPKVGGGKTGGVIDIAGKQHHGLPSHVEIWRQKGEVSLRYQPVPIDDGVLVVRTALRDPGTGEPRLFFNAHLNNQRDHESHPLGVLGEFNMYQYPKRTPTQNTTDKPIDKYNHSLKALGYWLYDHHGPVGERKPMPQATERGYWKRRAA